MKKVIAFFLSFVICFIQIIFPNTIKAADEITLYTASNTINCTGYYVAGTQAIKTEDTTTSYDSNSHYIYNTFIDTRWSGYTGTGWWGHNNLGWWFSYLAADGKWYYIRDTWLGLKDSSGWSWYFFDKNGYMITNKFAFVQNHTEQNPADYSLRSWFYFDSSGRMVSGWKYISYKGQTPHWYYFKVGAADDPYAANGSNVHNNGNFNFVANTDINSGHNESGNQYPYYIPSFKVKVSHKYRQADGTFLTNEEYKDVTLNSQDSQGNIIGETVVYPNIKNIDDNVKYIYTGDDSKTVKVAIKGNDSGISFTVNDTTNDVEFIYERPQYAVSLDKGTGISSVEGAGMYYYGANVNISANVLEGYSFLNWSGTYSSENNSYGFIMPAEDVKETANAFIKNEYNVTYIGNGGISSSDGSSTFIESVMYGSNYTIKSGNIFARTGYTFTGWNEKADGSGKSYNAGDTFNYTSLEGMTLYAQWSYDTVKVSVPQCLIGDKNGNSSFIVKSDIKSGNIVITAPDGFYYKQEGKDDVYAKITAENNTTITKDNQSVKYTIHTDGLSSGCWNGSFNIGMELNK